MERGRSDDSEDPINSRLDLFEKEVMPVVKRYKRENRLILVNGEQNALDVHRGIISKSR
jgi:adenylate kinase family enzyme